MSISSKKLVQRHARKMALSFVGATATLFGIGCGAAPVDYEHMTPDQIAVAEQAIAEECNGILLDGVLEEYKKNHDASDGYAASKAYCRDNSSSASGGGGGSFLDIVEVSGSGSSTVTDKYCQDFVTESSSEEATSLLTKTANTEVVKAWSACMTQRVGLACAQKPGTKAIELTWDELNNEGELTRTTLSKNNMKISNEADAKSTLYIGKTTLLFSTPDPSLDSTLVFNGLAAKTNVKHSCTVVSKGSAGIRSDITKSWTTLTARYKDISNKVAAMRNDKNAMYVDEVLKAVNAKYADANAKKVACTGGGSCSVPPLGIVFNYTYKIPGLKCPNGKIQDKPSSATRSAIDTTGDIQATVVASNAIYSQVPTCSSGVFSMTSPKPYL